MITVHKVRIVRFANEGFDIKRETGALSFYDMEVSNYRDEYRLLRGKDPIHNQTINGCYCHFYKFNIQSIQKGGILARRQGQKINIGYLPLDYAVYARNMRPDKDNTRIVRVHREIQDPSNGNISTFQDDSYWDAYAWVRMKLSLLIERTDEYLKTFKTDFVPEHLSEIFLTTDDLRLIEYKKQLKFKFQLGSKSLIK
jgi:GH18 family chitinase